MTQTTLTQRALFEKGWPYEVPNDLVPLRHRWSRLLTAREYGKVADVSNFWFYPEHTVAVLRLVSIKALGRIIGRQRARDLTCSTRILGDGVLSTLGGTFLCH